jgi:hypothetical protein
MNANHLTLAAVAALAAAGAVRRQGSRSDSLAGRELIDREEWVDHVHSWGIAGEYRKREDELVKILLPALYDQIAQDAPSLLSLEPLSASLDDLFAGDLDAQREANFYVRLAGLPSDQQAHFAQIHSRQRTWFLPIHGPMNILEFIEVAQEQGERLPPLPARRKLDRTLRRLRTKIANENCATQPVRAPIEVPTPWIQIRTEEQARLIGERMKNCLWWHQWCARTPEDRYEEFYHPDLDILVTWDPDSLEYREGFTDIQVGVDARVLAFEPFYFLGDRKPYKTVGKPHWDAIWDLMIELGGPWSGQAR